MRWARPTRAEVRNGNGALIVAQESAFDAAHRVTVHLCQSSAEYRQYGLLLHMGLAF